MRSAEAPGSNRHRGTAALNPGGRGKIGKCPASLQMAARRSPGSRRTIPAVIRARVGAGRRRGAQSAPSGRYGNRRCPAGGRFAARGRGEGVEGWAGNRCLPPRIPTATGQRVSGTLLSELPIGVNQSTEQRRHRQLHTAPSHEYNRRRRHLMLTKFDDYPIHQTAEPIAHPASSDRNEYDRYWYNGYANDGEFYFAVGMGLYPNRGILDCGFGIVRDGGQHAFHASKRAAGEPTDTTVRPWRIAGGGPG